MKKADLVINLLVAVAISLIVNFSYLILFLGQPREEWRPHIPNPEIAYPGEGVLSVSPDGYGYLIYEGTDSVYVPQQRIRWFKLQDGDVLEVDVRKPRQAAGHLVMNRIYMLDGEEFDYEQYINYPSETQEVVWQLIFYFTLSLLLMMTVMRILCRQEFRSASLLKAVLLCSLIVVVLFLLAPMPDWYSGNIRPNFTHQRMFDSMLIMKCSFTAIVSILYAWIRLLLQRQQVVEMEMEQLQNESLTARYNLLVGQISPHFFFNSLNSLSMLVREQHNEQALSYIDQLSYSFRYIIQNGQNRLVPLSDELRFAESFSYQYSIRFADKLFFDFQIEDRYRDYLLPALSLQPLIGNAVKHNTITKNKPLHVVIRTVDGVLEVQNPIVPKIEPEPSTGIGLQNLRNRWRLITGHEFEIIDDGHTFTVRLPLQKPNHA